MLVSRTVFVAYFGCYTWLVSHFVHDRSKVLLFCGSILLFMLNICLRYVILSVSCSLVVTCWERADLMALLCVMFSCVFVTFTNDVLGQVWYLFASIPDICFLLN